VPQVRCSGCFSLASWSAIFIGPGDVSAGCLDLTGAVLQVGSGLGTKMVELLWFCLSYRLTGLLLLLVINFLDVLVSVWLWLSLCGSEAGGDGCSGVL
jgi:hypothetical protein